MTPASFGLFELLLACELTLQVLEMKFWLKITDLFTVARRLLWTYNVIAHRGRQSQPRQVP